MFAKSRITPSTDLDIVFEFSFLFQVKQMYIIQLLHTFLGNNENYRPEVLWTTWCSIARGRKAEGDSASGRPQHRGGDSFHCCPKIFVTVVLLPNPGAFFLNCT